MKKIDTKALFNRKIEKLLRIIRIMVEEIGHLRCLRK